MRKFNVHNKQYKKKGFDILQNIRKAAVAGQFYEGDKNSLEKRIETCFLENRGPGVVPEINQGEKDVNG